MATANFERNYSDLMKKRKKIQWIPPSTSHPCFMFPFCQHHSFSCRFSICQNDFEFLRFLFIENIYLQTLAIGPEHCVFFVYLILFRHKIEGKKSASKWHTSVFRFALRWGSAKSSTAKKKNIVNKKQKSIQIFTVDSNMPGW